MLVIASLRILGLVYSNEIGAKLKFLSSASSAQIFFNNGVYLIVLKSFVYIWEFGCLSFLSCFGQHCCNENGTTRPLLLVTASVDKMVLKKPIHIYADLTIVGTVTWVGRSSMEIQLELTQSSQGTAWLIQTDYACFNRCFFAGLWALNINVVILIILVIECLEADRGHVTIEYIMRVLRF